MKIPRQSRQSSCFHNFPVNDLQVTQIGRIVNELRKKEGKVGFAAKALIDKWKLMVMAETISSSGSDDYGSDGKSIVINRIIRD